MKVIWSEEEAEYHGEFVNFDPIWSHPKPLQKPHPPILLGSHTESGLNRIAKYCDGWLPIGAMMPDFKASIGDLRARVEKVGRTASDIGVSSFMAPAEEPVLQQYQEMGVERAIFGVPSEGRDMVLPILDNYATLIPKLA